MLFNVCTFRSEWRRGTEDTESHPAVSSWRVTDHINPILCVRSITLTDADIIPDPGSWCLVALMVTGHCGLPTHFYRVKSNVTSRLRFVSSPQRPHSETLWWLWVVHHLVLWLSKPLIGRWCNRTYPNPGKLILMTIWAVSDCLCLLVWSLASHDSEDAALRSRPKVTEASFVCLTVHYLGLGSLVKRPDPAPRKHRAVLHKL